MWGEIRQRCTAPHEKGQCMQNYLTLTELRAKLGNRSRSAIYLDLAAGRLPQPVKLGGRLYWPEGDVETHLRNMREQVA
jgi:prophage regulatory protein